MPYYSILPQRMSRTKYYSSRRTIVSQGLTLKAAGTVRVDSTRTALPTWDCTHAGSRLYARANINRTKVYKACRLRCNLIRDTEGQKIFCDVSGNQIARIRRLNNKFMKIPNCSNRMNDSESVFSQGNVFPQVESFQEIDRFRGFVV